MIDMNKEEFKAYYAEGKLMSHNPIGMFSKRACSDFWENYRNQDEKKWALNLKYIYN
jgi:hypothetical protein